VPVQGKTGQKKNENRLVHKKKKYLHEKRPSNGRGGRVVSVEGRKCPTKKSGKKTCV